MVYVRITSSGKNGGIGFRKVKNFSAMHRQERENMPVNEVSGYRIFGGCLNAYMDAYLLVQYYVNFSIVLAKYDGDIKTKRKNHIESCSCSEKNSYGICTFKIIY